jgi:hypothetical protein
MELVERHKWNNFLQLKVIAICDEVLENCENQQFKKFFLESSGLAAKLTQMSKDANYTMESGREIRNGHMGLVVKISNKLVSKCPVP